MMPKQEERKMEQLMESTQADKYTFAFGAVRKDLIYGMT